VHTIRLVRRWTLSREEGREEEGSEYQEFSKDMGKRGE
jgi:hypothetical protein